MNSVVSIPMNWKVIFALLIALGCSVALVSCDGSATAKTVHEKKLEELQAIFEKTRADRNSLYAEKWRLSYLLKTAESQLVSVTEQRDSLQQQAKELIQAEEQSRSRVDTLARSEAELRERINVVELGRQNSLVNVIDERKGGFRDLASFFYLGRSFVLRVRSLISLGGDADFTVFGQFFRQWDSDPHRQAVFVLPHGLERLG